MLHSIHSPDLPTLSFIHTFTDFSTTKILTQKQQDARIQSRQQSQFMSASYQRSLRRSFARAKQLAFFNPDMTEFITFTYRGSSHTPDDVLKHIKQLVKTEQRKRKTQGRNNYVNDFGINEDLRQRPLSDFSTGNGNTNARLPVGKLSDSTKILAPKSVANTPKYIFVLEYQKRGSIHVHMISNNYFTTEINKNGYRSLKYWNHGYTSVLTIDDFDKDFKPYLYLFKYMKKAERIGRSFIHTSRGFDKIKTRDYADYEDFINNGGNKPYHIESNEFEYNNVKYKSHKHYYRI